MEGLFCLDIPINHNRPLDRYSDKQKCVGVADLLAILCLQRFLLDVVVVNIP